MAIRFRACDNERNGKSSPTENMVRHPLGPVTVNTVQSSSYATENADSTNLMVSWISRRRERRPQRAVGSRRMGAPAMRLSIPSRPTVGSYSKVTSVRATASGFSICDFPTAPASSTGATRQAASEMPSGVFARQVVNLPKRLGRTVPATITRMNHMLLRSNSV